MDKTMVGMRCHAEKTKPGTHLDSLSYNQLVDLIKLLKGDKYPEKVIGNVQTALTNKVHLIKKIII